MTDRDKQAARVKKPKITPPKPRNPENLEIDERFVTPMDKEKYKAAKTEDEKRSILATISARALTRTEVRSASVIQKFEGAGLDLMATIGELADQNAKVKAGDMGYPEAMLLSQAHALEALFSNLARRAHSNMVEGYGEAAERYMKLALRAQNQCRTTIEALSAIKNPPVVFAKQMNVSNGPQQVNNGVASQPTQMAKDVTHTSKNKTGQNKLLEEQHVQRLDTRTQEAAIRANKELETLGEINRP